MSWLTSLFKKKQPILPPEPPKYEPVIVLADHIIVRARMNVPSNLKLLDPNYAGTMVRDQITKDITNQIVNSPQLIEWINTYDMGTEWVEARVKVMPV